MAGSSPCDGANGLCLNNSLIAGSSLCRQFCTKEGAKIPRSSFKNLHPAQRAIIVYDELLRQFFKGTRGIGRVRKMWSGRERVGTVTRIPSCFRSRQRIPNPSPSLVSVPNAYRPNVRHLVPVPTVFRPAVRCIIDFSLPVVCAVVPLSHHDVRTTQFLPSPKLLTTVRAYI